MKTLIGILLFIFAVGMLIFILYGAVKTALTMPDEFGENHADEEILKQYLKRERLRRMTKDVEDRQLGEVKTTELNIDYQNIEGK